MDMMESLVSSTEEANPDAVRKLKLAVDDFFAAQEEVMDWAGRLNLTNKKKAKCAGS